MNTLRLLLLLKATKSIIFKLYNQKRYVFYKLLKSLRRKRKYVVISTDTPPPPSSYRQPVPYFEEQKVDCKVKNLSKLNKKDLCVLKVDYIRVFNFFSF